MTAKGKIQKIKNEFVSEKSNSWRRNGILALETNKKIKNINKSNIVDQKWLRRMGQE